MREIICIDFSLASFVLFISLAFSHSVCEGGQFEQEQQLPISRLPNAGSTNDFAALYFSPRISSSYNTG